MDNKCLLQLCLPTGWVGPARSDGPDGPPGRTARLGRTSQWDGPVGSSPVGFGGRGLPDELAGGVWLEGHKVPPSEVGPFSLESSVKILFYRGL